MKKLFYVLVVVALLSFPGYSDQKYSVTIEITNIEEVKGRLMVAIFNSADAYQKDDAEYMDKIVNVTDKTMTVVFKNVNPGEYAVKTFHDINSNGTLDKRGYCPIEPFGYSNNPRIKFGEPSFERTKFKVNSNCHKRIRLLML